MKKLAIVLAALIMTVFAMASVVACDVTWKESHDFTVKVLNADGTPAKNILIQPCVVEENGELGVCYNIFNPVNAEGVAYVDIGDDQNTQIPTSAGVTKIEIHLFSGTSNSDRKDLPPYLTYGHEQRLDKGNSITITLKNKTQSELDTLTGAGTGEYENDTIKDANCDPYKVDFGTVNGVAYGVKFTEATQLKFFKLDIEEGNYYKVYAVNNDGIKIMRLQDKKKSTASDRNVTGSNALTFDAPASRIEYFEVSVTDAGVNKDTIICFEVSKTPFN